MTGTISFYSLDRRLPRASSILSKDESSIFSCCSSSFIYSQPHIAKRVKHLILYSNWFQPVNPKSPQTLRTTLASYLPFGLGRFIDPILHDVSDVRKGDILIHNTVLNFSNLASLEVINRSCPYYPLGDIPEEPLRLFQSFPRQRGHPAFPMLTSFSLVHSELSTSRSPILMQFLDQHAGTLKHLKLQHAVPLFFVSKPFLPVVLPHLVSLDIDSQGLLARYEFPPREGPDAAWDYAQHCRSTLTSLYLTNHPFSLCELGTLLDLLGRRLSENAEGLKNLTVTVQVLSPDLLDMLAEKLPQLDRLELNFAYLRTTDVPVGIYSSTRYRHLTQKVSLTFLFFSQWIQSDASPLIF
jgi:hypothetical protein